MFKKLTAFLALAVMLFSISSCSSTEWVVKNGDTEITSGIYLGFLTQMTLSEMQEHSAYTTADLMKMTIHEKSAEAYVQELALSLCKEYISIEKKFKELNLSLTEEDEKEIESTLASYKSYYGTIFSDNGCGDVSLKAMIANEKKLEKIFYHLYNEGGEKGVSDADKRAYFNENYVRVQFISIPLYDDSTGDDLEGEALEKVKAKAKSYKERADKGESFIDLKNEFEKESSTSSSSSTDKKYTNEIQDNGFTNADNLVPKNKSSYPAEFITAVFEMKVGEVKVVEIDSVCFVIKKLNLNESEKAYDSNKDSILAEMRSEEYSTLQTEWKNALQYETNTASVKRYSPKKIKIDMTAN